MRALDQLNRRIRLTDDLVGDFRMLTVTVNQEKKFILGAVYIHSNVPQEAIEYFMFQMLGAYSEAISLIFPNMNPGTETPILPCGDFNMDIMQNKSCVNFMKSKFNLDCISSASTTLCNTCIDLTFAKNISVQTIPYVSYLSYHRPVFSRLMLSSEQ
jgi:hypothetical protein